MIVPNCLCSDNCLCFEGHCVYKVLCYRCESVKFNEDALLCAECIEDDEADEIIRRKLAANKILRGTRDLMREMVVELLDRAFDSNEAAKKLKEESRLPIFGPIYTRKGVINPTALCPYCETMRLKEELEDHDGMCQSCAWNEDGLCVECGDDLEDDTASVSVYSDDNMNLCCDCAKACRKQARV